MKLEANEEKDYKDALEKAENEPASFFVQLQDSLKIKRSAKSTFKRIMEKLGEIFHTYLRPNVFSLYATPPIRSR